MLLIIKEKIAEFWDFSDDDTFTLFLYLFLLLLLNVVPTTRSSHLFTARSARPESIHARESTLNLLLLYAQEPTQNNSNLSSIPSINVYHYISLYINVYQCISMYITIYINVNQRKCLIICPSLKRQFSPTTSSSPLSISRDSTSAWTLSVSLNTRPTTTSDRCKDRRTSITSASDGTALEVSPLVYREGGSSTSTAGALTDRADRCECRNWTRVLIC